MKKDEASRIENTNQNSRIAAISLHGGGTIGPQFIVQTRENTQLQLLIEELPKFLNDKDYWLLSDEMIQGIMNKVPELTLDSQGKLTYPENKEKQDPNLKKFISDEYATYNNHEFSKSFKSNLVSRKRIRSSKISGKRIEKRKMR